MDKKDFRLEMLRERQALGRDEVSRRSRIIQERLLELPEWREAERVLLYMPVRNEVDVLLLLSEAWSRNMTVLLPRCRRDRAGIMDIAQVHGLDDLSVGLFNIMEPCEDRCPGLGPEEWDLDMAVIPGLAFDQRGYRLGYGGGYYDRFLPRAAETKKTVLAGLCFSFQLVEALPADDWDTPMNLICTEDQLVRI